MEITFKIHQIFALVDVKYEHVFPTVSTSIRDKNLMTHFNEIAQELSSHNGLNYVPRERTTDGRVFEHAADCKVLIDHLSQLPSDMKASGQSHNYTPPSMDDVQYYIQIIEESTGQKDGVDSDYAKLAQRYEQKIFEELNISKEKNIVLKINK